MTVGSSVQAGASRKLYDLAFQSAPESFELAPGQVQMLSGHQLARAYVLKAMYLVYKILGVREDRQPDDELQMVINRYVARKYSHFTVEDVYEAFVQGVAGELRGVDMSTYYGEVNLPYLASVWDAYDRQFYPKSRQRELVAPVAEPLPRELIGETRRKSDEAVKNSLRDAFYARLSGSPLSFIVLAEQIYYLLLDLGIMAPLPVEETTRIWEQAVKRVVADVNHNSFRAMMINVEQAVLNKNERCRQEAYRITVAGALIQMERDGWDAEALGQAMERLCRIGVETHEQLYKMQWKHGQSSASAQTA